MHLTLRSGSVVDNHDHRQKEKVPEEHRLLLAA
jgi:hypothetical protein